jgi:hypothetical protein
MCSPFEFEEVGHLQHVARSSVPNNSQKPESTHGLRDSLVVLAIVAAFAGVLIFLLFRGRNAPQLPAAVRRERWKDWRPIR